MYLIFIISYFPSSQFPNRGCIIIAVFLMFQHDVSREEDAMSNATNLSFDSSSGRLIVPQEIRKLNVNKDTGETIMHKVARSGKEVRR